MSELKRTQLYDVHVAAGATMVDFGGWEMPIKYPTDIVAEHLYPRHFCSLFDVSHMGRVLVEGPEGRRSLPVAGVFAAVGLVPDNQVFSPPLELDGAGYIVAGEDTRTNVPGVFAAGDTRVKDLRQLVTAAADGASAAAQAGRYLQAGQ